MPKNDSLTLYEVETELMETFDQVQELQQAGNEEELASALFALEAYIKESVHKRDRCGKFLETLESTQVSIDLEIERLQDRKKRIAKAREAMCQYILLVMNRIGVQKLEGELFSFKARKNPPSVSITDPVALPPDYLRQPDPPPPVPDKKLIKEDLARGVDVPGACLQQSTRLVIDN